MQRGWLSRILDIQIERIVGSLLLCAIFCVMVFAVVLRYGFGISMTWYEEFGRFGLIAISILSIGAGFKNNTHITIDNGYLPKPAQAVLNRINWALSFAFIAGFAYYAIMLSSAVRASKSPAMQVPMSWLYMTVGCIAMLGIIRLLERAFFRRDR